MHVAASHSLASGLTCVRAFRSTESDAREGAALAGLHSLNDHHIYCFHMRGEGLSIEELQWRKGSQVALAITDLVATLPGAAIWYLKSCCIWLPGIELFPL